MAVASGKVILLGEHAVVYDHPALVAGIDNGALASVEVDGHSSIVVGNYAANLNQGVLGTAFAELMNVLNTPPLRASVQLNIPPGCGLGASAAAGVALARAALNLLDPLADETPPRRKTILKAAQAWETVFHGNPSGIDATAATLGGCFTFRRSTGPDPVVLGQPLTLAIAVADEPAQTRVIVEKVAELRNQDEQRINGIFGRIAQLVAAGQAALRSGQASALGQLMNDNQVLLQQLTVSTAKLDEACELARDAGALGAKLTGSGGGGCVIALCDLSAETVLAAWQRRNLACFSVTVQSNR